MDNLNNLTYGIVGLGIMGGSIAKSIRKNVIINSQNGKIFALDKNHNSLICAKQSKIIDEYFNENQTEKMLKKCDIVFICLYPQQTFDFLLLHKNDFKDNSLITDISGVKIKLCKNYEQICPKNATLILGHPMAGGEKEGFDFSNDFYFINHNYILITKGEFLNQFNENKKNDFFQKVIILEQLIYKMGFSLITQTDYQTHDEKICFTSQLCHVVASALVNSTQDEEITSFGGGSFEDLTRIALINAPLWTELFLENKGNLVSQIEIFTSKINEIKNLIKNEDKNGINLLLKKVREKRAKYGKSFSN